MKISSNKYYLILSGFLIFILCISLALNNHSILDIFKTNKKPLITSQNHLPKMIFKIFGKNEEFNTEQMKGQKYILHFFATWCGYCMDEYQELLKITDQKLPIYGVAWQDSEENIKQLINYNPNTPFKEILLDPYGYQSRPLNLGAIPQTFIINEKSEVVFYFKGVINPEDLLKIYHKS